jgi:hypothetical protein
MPRPSNRTPRSLRVPAGYPRCPAPPRNLGTRFRTAGGHDRELARTGVTGHPATEPRTAAVARPGCQAPAVRPATSRPSPGPR